jgi:hypothetical protein
MDKEIVVRLHSSFEAMVQKFPETGTEFWCARDLQMLLGYAQWKNFAKVIDKAITACQNAGHDPKDHFAGISKMVDLGSGAKREIQDIALTRYACYLIAQNGDPAKEQIAFAQTYFAVQTRKQDPAQRVTTGRRNRRQDLPVPGHDGDFGYRSEQRPPHAKPQSTTLSSLQGQRALRFLAALREPPLCRSFRIWPARFPPLSVAVPFPGASSPFPPLRLYRQWSVFHPDSRLPVPGSRLSWPVKCFTT